MERQAFNKQLYRLKSQWPHSYGPERIERIWQVFQRMEDGLFSRIVDRALDKMRSAPLSDDLCKIEGEIKGEDSAHREQTNATLSTVLLQSAKSSKSANKEYMQACLRHLEAFTTKAITREAFMAGCDDLMQLADTISPETAAKKPFYGIKHSPRDLVVKD